MDLLTQFGIVSILIGVVVIFFTNYFMWTPNDNISSLIKIVQSEKKIKWTKVILIILIVVWLIIFSQLLAEAYQILVDAYKSFVRIFF